MRRLTQGLHLNPPCTPVLGGDRSVILALRRSPGGHASAAASASSNPHPSVDRLRDERGFNRSAWLQSRREGLLTGTSSTDVPALPWRIGPHDRPRRGRHGGHRLSTRLVPTATDCSIAVIRSTVSSTLGGRSNSEPSTTRKARADAYPGPRVSARTPLGCTASSPLCLADAARATFFARLARRGDAPTFPAAEE
jgi:hypothetical protein